MKQNLDTIGPTQIGFAPMSMAVAAQVVQAIPDDVPDNPLVHQ
nr:hypothetical protein [Mariniblastus sp.]